MIPGHINPLNKARDTAIAPEDIAHEAVKLTEGLLHISRQNLGFFDQLRGRKLERMMLDEPGKALTLQLADQVFRSKSPINQSREFQRLLRHHGIPRYLWWWERGLMSAGSLLSRISPALVMPLIARYIRAESSNVIKPSEKGPLSGYLNRRRADGFGINLNQLGEAVLGEEEALRRLNEVITRLKSPEVDYLSVKISAIYSQINLIAFDATLQELQNRLRMIYRAAGANLFADANGNSRPKFVNLDMEDYRDFDLTVAVFKSVLSEPEFMNLEAGIVLQAYLPDSANMQEELTKWAIARIGQGGAGIKIRVVKGANLAMEHMEASIHGWQQAPYDNKPDSDANFKRMIRFGCETKNANAVRIGVGSHNLFDISYAMLCAQLNGVNDRVEFEMLEGMANHQAAAVLDEAGNLLLYAPVVEHRHFHSALAYLVRRLDENTAEENYLRHMFLMMPGSPAWDSEKSKFLKACTRAEIVRSTPRRTQNRLQDPELKGSAVSGFINSPDTDWSMPANRQWITLNLEKWSKMAPDPVAMQIDGQFRYNASTQVQVMDPSRPGHCAYSHTLAGINDVEEALSSATRAWQQWSSTPFVHRADILKKAAGILESGRGDTIGCLILDGAKAINEADTEISEAIDFADYYSRLDEVEGVENCEFTGRGVVVVAPPWNFPYAIPAGGVLAALAAGNSVILKPSLHTVLIAYRLACQLWEAGIPKEVLQFIPCPEDDTGRALITDRRVDTVVLTGSYQTGKMFKSWKADLRLIAETSGKNSMVITAAADVDQAVSDLVHSAFGHSGQKCSAASLAVVESEIYQRDDFLRQLRDAAQSLHVGSAWDPRSVVTPLVDPPNEALSRALTTLEQGEEWLLEPTCIDGNPHLWSPGIKIGVQSDGWFANTECFGPVLGIIRVKNLDEAIEIQNSGDFGLTGGIQSLNPDEIRKWSRALKLGNAYINRGITGAIVGRQPFGGWGHSSFGPGAKAGGPDYVMNFANWRQLNPAQPRVDPGEKAIELLEEVGRLGIDQQMRDTMLAAAGHYAWAMHNVFGKSHDPSGLISERNQLRYHGHELVTYRIDGGDIIQQSVLAGLACMLSGIHLDLSMEENAENANLLKCLGAVEGITARIENSDQFSGRMSEVQIRNAPGIIRTSAVAALEIHEIANRLHVPLVSGEILANGRLELRHWFREQCVSETTHRYGNIMPRFRRD
jgi:RHH-type proline utilization regulon transcriptional repressor/proline dehydrogenase/delta 1-pyrroline-5-carboxylate dehydrogenase